MRKAERIALDEPVRLDPNDWSSVEVHLLDCSESGFRARCDVRIAPGFLVNLEIPGIGRSQAYVIWCRGGEIGGKFVVPLDLAGAAFKPIGEEKMLARLLVQRARAHKSGRFDQEQQLRDAIARTLPIRKG